MPIDPSRLPALERELEMAKNVYPGGQPPNASRIAAIEEEIAKHRGVETPVAPEPENLSNEPTDYESTDDVDEKRAEKVAKRKKAADAGEVETAESTADPMETAHA